MIVIDKEEQKIFDLLIAYKKLTRDILSNHFSNEKKPITRLLRNGLIVKITNKDYDIPYYEKLFQYGKILEQKGDEDSASICFLLCEYHDPQNTERAISIIRELLSKNIETSREMLNKEGISFDLLKDLLRRKLVRKRYNSFLLTRREDQNNDTPENCIIEEQLKKKIYDHFIAGNILKKSRNMRFLISELSDAEMLGLIELNSSNYYVPIWNEFYAYGEELLEAGQESEATKCFEIFENNKQENLKKYLTKYYELITFYQTLTENTLLENGFTKSMINALFQNGLIKKVNKYFITPADMTSFNEYLQYLKKIGKDDEADICLSIYTEEDDDRLQKYLQTIYDLVAKYSKITVQAIIDEKIPNQLVNKLHRAGYLRKEGYQTYILTRYDGLIEYAQNLERKGNIEGAINCYVEYLRASEKISRHMQIMALHDNVRFKLITYYFEQKQYKECFNYLLALQNDQKFVTIFNFYLYLLNFITVLPEEYRKIAKNFFPDQMEAIHEKDKDENDKIVDLALAQKFRKAVSQLENANIDLTTPQNRLTLTLLKKVANKNKSLKNAIINAIDREDTKQIVEILLFERKLHPLLPIYRIFLDIALSIEIFKKNKTIPTQVLPKSNKLIDLIQANRFEEARQLNRNMAQKRQIPPEKNYLEKLLSLAIKTFKKIEEQPATQNNEMNEILTKIMHLLKNKETDTLEILIEDLLTQYNQTNYKYLIFALIDISYKTGDYTFKAPIGTIKKVLRGDFVVNIDFYKKMFDECIERESIENAELYVDLIEEIIINGHSDLPDDESNYIWMRMKVKIASKKHKMTPKED